MQRQRFVNGGFVIHKILIDGSHCHFSAWFDREGKLLDCERIDIRGRSMPVKGTKQREALQRVGNRWKHTPIPPN